MSNVTSTSKKSHGPWDRYMAKWTEIYLLFLMVVFVIFCKQGYVDYDIHKRSLFYVGAAIFVIGAVFIHLISLSNMDKISWKPNFERADLWFVGIFGSWLIGVLLCEDKNAAIWGDSYRYMGMVYMGLCIVTMWIISRYAEWTKWLLRITGIVGIIIFIWQIMNFYYIDPLNWTYDGQYYSLMSCLSNINQNACYNVMFLAIAMAIFVLAKTRMDQIVVGIYLFIGYMAGIACSSNSYYLGIGIVFVVMLAYVLRHAEYLWEFWIEVVLFVAAVIAQKVLYAVVDDPWMTLETTTQILMDVRVLVALSVALVVVGLLLWKCKNFFATREKLLSNIYIGVILVVLIVGIICFIYANVSGVTAEDGSVFSYLVMNDMSGNARWLIWKCTVGMFVQEPIGQKLFGIGLSNYSIQIYRYYVNEICPVWGIDTRLADAHSVVFDMLASSGLVGMISFYGVSFHVLIKSVKIVKKQPVALMAILGICAWIAVGLVNSNLIVTTPVYLGLLGLFWSFIRKNEKNEETKEFVGII